jgi:hypothetical protein
VKSESSLPAEMSNVAEPAPCCARMPISLRRMNYPRYSVRYAVYD